MKRFDLKDGFEVIEITPREFAVNYIIYGHGNNNIWFPTKMERAFKVFENIADGYFAINYNGKKIGGFIMEPNLFGLLYLIPPYVDEWSVLKKIFSLVKSESDKSKPIKVYSVQKGSYENFNKLGFQIVETEKVMIRPTEEFDVQWEDDIYFDVPKEEYKSQMIDIYYDVYSSSPVKCISNKDKDFFTNLLNGHIPESISEYSTLIFDKNTNELVASCLVLMWEELPYISDIVVRDSHKGRGLGTLMIKKVLNNAYDKYPAVRLSIRSGNRAEGLYSELGFISGDETSEMVLENY